MQLKRFIIPFLVLLIMLPLFATPVAQTHTALAQEAGYEPVFTPIDCPASVSAPPQVECGIVTVPEDRSQPEGNQVELMVFRFPAKSQNPQPDPLVYLEGGPGAGGSRFVQFADYLFGTYNLDRDVIFFDQRGTGLSSPSLQCPDFGLSVWEAYANLMTLEEGADHVATTLLACYQDYLDQGIDLNQYTTAQNAADLDDIRRAMGYEEWNVYGISYGSRLALTAMRDYPEGIRAAVIDGVVPVQGDLYLETPSNGFGAINRLFELCAADEQCNATYPDLESVFYEVLDQLNDNPAQLSALRGLDGNVYSAQLDGQMFVGIMFFNLYSTQAISFLPYVIYAARAGDFTFLEEFLLDSYFVWDDIATVMHYAVNCNEEIAYNTFEEIEAASEGLPATVARNMNVDNYMTWEICQGWEAGPLSPVEDEPVVSDIPTLLTSGSLDPITPPRWGDLAAETLANGYHYVIEGGGHGISFSSDCVRDMMNNFLDDPTTDPGLACVDATRGPEFTIRPVTLPE